MQNIMKTHIILKKCMSVLSSKCKGISIPRIYLDNNVLSWVESQKYLGVLLRSDLNDFNDMRRQLRAIYGKGNLYIYQM